MNSTGRGEPDPGPPLSPSGGLLLYGEGVPTLTAGHIAAIGLFARNVAIGNILVATIADTQTVGERAEVDLDREDYEPFSFAGLSDEELQRLSREVVEAETTIEDLSPKLTEAFQDGLRGMAYNEPDEAVRIFRVIAAAPDESSRRGIAILIPHLVRSSPEPAMMMWESLLRDSNEQVAEEARDTLRGVCRELLDERAITPMQALRLARAYREGPRQSSTS